MNNITLKSDYLCLSRQCHRQGRQSHRQGRGRFCEEHCPSQGWDRPPELPSFNEKANKTPAVFFCIHPLRVLSNQNSANVSKKLFMLSRGASIVDFHSTRHHCHASHSGSLLQYQYNSGPRNKQTKIWQYDNMSGQIWQSIPSPYGGQFNRCNSRQLMATNKQTNRLDRFPASLPAASGLVKLTTTTWSLIDKKSVRLISN